MSTLRIVGRGLGATLIALSMAALAVVGYAAIWGAPLQFERIVGTVLLTAGIGVVLMMVSE